MGVREGPAGASGGLSPHLVGLLLRRRSGARLDAATRRRRAASGVPAAARSAQRVAGDRGRRDDPRGWRAQGAVPHRRRDDQRAVSPLVSGRARRSLEVDGPAERDHGRDHLGRKQRADLPRRGAAAQDAQRPRHRGGVRQRPWRTADGVRSQASEGGCGLLRAARSRDVVDAQARSDDACGVSAADAAARACDPSAGRL